MEKGIIISSVVLNNAFKELSKVKVDKSSPIPILDYLKLECFQDEVFLVKTNLTDTVKIRLENCEWNFEGAFLLDPNVGVLMSKIDQQPVTVRIKDDDVKVIHIGGDDFNVKFEVDHVDDFPLLENNFDVVGAMDYSLFRNTLEKLSPFMSTDELRPTMTGFCFNKTHVVTTDGHTMRYIPNPGLKLDHELILRNIMPYLPKPSKNNSLGDAYFEISEDHKMIKIEFGDHLIYSRLIDEKYPNYMDVIPTEFNTDFTVNNTALKKVTDQALVFANKTTKQVRININDQLEFSAEDLDFNHEFNRKIDYLKKSGDDIVVGVNGSLLIKCLKYLDDKVKMEFVDPNKPMILNGEILLMPVMLSNYA